MASFAAERPTFFEGQYIGADDLDAIVDYLRVMVSRQNLGQHTWGVAIGLDIISQAVSDTAVEYFIQPGVAVDGFGRIIVVSTPARIDAEKFVSIGSGNIDIWIRYEQSEFEAVRSGFQVCSAQDEYRRVNETFAIEVGSKPSILNRHSSITVNESIVTDAREALVSVNPDAPLLCDASIPHQQLPVDDENDFWLIPLGHVRWSAATSNFVPLVDPQQEQDLENGIGVLTPDQVYEALMNSRRKRRLIGAVAESIYSAEGLIRLRERTAPFDAAVENDTTCNERKINSRDLFVCEGQPKPKELIWLEGHTRITGDTRLLNGRLEFRDEEGRDYIQRTVEGNLVSPISPLLLQRNNNSNNGVDLQILLGESSDGRNRLTVGQGVVSGDNLCDEAITYSPQILLQDNGRMGVGTVEPQTALLAPLTIRGLQEEIIENEGTEDEVTYDVLRLLNFEGQGGALEWQLDLWSDLESLSFNETGDGTGRLFLQAGGNIGVGTLEPVAKLDIANVEVSSNGSNLGEDLWFRVGDGGDAGRVWIEYGDAAAPLLVLSDSDNPPRIQFQQTESEEPDDDFSPVHQSWIGHAKGESSDLAIMGGNLGVGTDEPNSALTVLGNGGSTRFYSGVNGGHVWLGFYTDGNPGSSRAGWLGYGSDGNSDFTIQNQKTNGDIVLLPNRNVGIGISTPSDKLEVRGNIRLGSSGDLFAVAGEENLRCIVGRVSSSGNRLQGDGFESSRISTGRYEIEFDDNFSNTPVVVATLYDHLDNIVSVDTIGINRFEVQVRDIRDRNEDLSSNSITQVQNAGFTFIAMGLR